MFKNFYASYFLFFFLLLQASSEAREPDVKEFDAWLDVGAMTGYSSTSVPDRASSPTLLQIGASFSLGVHFYDFLMFGGTSDYRLTNQYSEPTRPIGNRKGVRFNPISPFVGASLERLILKLNFQIFGDYFLSMPTNLGGDVVYEKPFGTRGTALYRITPQLAGGAYIEYVTFSKIKIIDTHELSKKLSTVQFGVALTYTPFAENKRR